MPRYGALLTSTILFFICLAGCGSDRTTELGDWTLNPDTLTITEDLRVSETETYFFGTIQDLDVTTEGRMVVLDADAMHLKVLRPDGTLLDTLGRRGQGPGEFQGITSVDVARGDSVYVFDNQVNRLTVFTPPPAPERTRSGIVNGDVGNPVNVRVLSDRLVGEVTPGYTRKEGLYRPSPNTWHRLDGTSVSGDALLQAQRREVATSFGSGVAIAYLPFGRVTKVAAGPDGRLYHGFNDSLQIRATSLDGTTTSIAALPAPPVPVTEAERDSALAGIDAKIRGPIASALPDTKPAFTNLIVADDGRIWVRRPTDGPDAQTTAWWILDPDTKTVSEVQLPTDVNLEVIRGQKAYGTATPEAGAPALVRYRVEAGM